MVRVHNRRATCQVWCGDTNHCLTDSIWIGCPCLFNSLNPHIKTNVMCFHWIVGNTFIIFNKRKPFFDKFIIFWNIVTHEIIPCSHMPNKRFSIDTRQFFFANRKCNYRNISSGKTLITKFLVKRNISIAIDSWYYGRLFACWTKLFDICNYTLPIWMTKWCVVDHNIFILETFCF